MLSSTKLYLFVLIAFLFPAIINAQLTDTQFTNTAPPSPVGSGARAMGYGGAFIAIADDATAAKWNPGGLIQLTTPEASIAYSYQEYNVDDDSWNFANINYLSLVYPFSIGDVNISTSANYQRLYDFYFDTEFEISSYRTDQDATVVISDADFNGTPGPYLVELHDKEDQSFVDGMREIVGDVGAISPSMAVQITPEFSMGFTYNFWSDGIIGPDYKNDYQHDRSGTFTQTTVNYFDNSAPFVTCNGGHTCDDSNADRDDVDDLSVLGPSEFIGNTATSTQDYVTYYKSTQKLNFEGQNFNIGFLWNATPRFTIGGVYRSEFWMDLERQENIIRDDPTDPAPPNRLEFEYDEKMRFPASYGLGLAFRYSDELTMSFDATRTEWDRFVYEYENGDRISPVNGLPEDEADIDPTVTYRLGAEYLFIGNKYVVPLRGGFFYDPEPAMGDPDDYYGASIGSGLVYDRMVLDISYWYRWGNDVVLETIYSDESGNLEEKTGDTYRQMLMLSAILHLR